MSLNLGAAIGGMAITLTLAAPAARVHAQTLDMVLDRAIVEGRIVGGVVLVLQDGRPVYSRAAGFADREAGIPMREDSLFRLASVSKPYVTATALRLAERGLIDLDDPVTRFLPDFRPATSDGTRPVITLRHLITHQSGLSYRFWEAPDSDYARLEVSDGLDQPGLSLEENLDRLSRTTLRFAPGAGWRYSLGIDVLGAVLEKAADKPLPDLFREEIAAPLHLVDTGFEVADPNRLSSPYRDSAGSPQPMGEFALVPMDGGVVRFAPARALTLGSYPSGGAGMVGTASDLALFLDTLRTGGGGVLESDTVAAMARLQVSAVAQTQGPGWGFGFGWAVLDDPAKAGTPQSRGSWQWGGAYGHSWFVDPEAGLVVIALTNTAFEGMSGRFVTDVRDAVYRTIAPPPSR